MQMIQLGILGMALVVGAQGASIAIANAGFEDNVPTTNSCGGSCVFQPGLMSGWTASGPTILWGTWRPSVPPANDYFDVIPSGLNTGYAHFGSSLSQVVGETAVAGLTYTLEVELGWRKDYDVTSLGFIELVVGTTRVLATGTQPVQGGWSTYTATYAALSGDTGKTIEIYLGSLLNQLGNFDNARLSSSATPLGETNPVPEPGGMGIVGLAGLVLAGRWFKRA